GIQPLKIIDGQQQRPTDRQRAQHGQEPGGDREPLRCLIGGLGAQQRRLERAPLRDRQAADPAEVDASEQVVESREPELRLGPAAARLARATSTCTPWSLARRSPRSQRAVLPMPCPPVSSSAGHGGSWPTNSSSTASSGSRPITSYPLSAVSSPTPAPHR